MPSIPSVLIIGVNPIVQIVVPLVRTFGFHVAHLWSYQRLTNETVSLCRDTLKIDSYSCTMSSLENLLNDSNENYLIFICTETDQHASLVRQLTTMSTNKNSLHHVICMPPFHVDPKNLISYQANQQQLFCYCYPLGFLPTFIKLKRYLIEEQVQLADIQSIEFRVYCSSLKSSSNDRINGSLLNRFGSLVLAVIFYLFGTQNASTISHAYLQPSQEKVCSFHLNYNRLMNLPPIVVNLLSNSHLSSNFNQRLEIGTSKNALIVNDYQFLVRRFPEENQILIDSFNAETHEKFLGFGQENPEIPLMFIQSFFYFIGHLKESIINRMPRSTFAELTSFELVSKVQETLVAVREAARTGDIVPIVR